VVITAGYEWAAKAEGDERACSGRATETKAVAVRTTVELVAGDPVVGVEAELDNRCRDHRLRVHFPLPVPVTGSDAGCAFAVVHRGLDVEGGPSETPPPTFPARRFVDCSGPWSPAGAPGPGTAGLAVIADGTFEYEAGGHGRELAMTVLRATGWLSRRRLPLRPDPAGPAVPVEGAQVQGVRRRRYGLLLHAGDWEAADLMGRAAAFLDPLEAVAGPVAAGPDPAATAAGRTEPGGDGEFRSPQGQVLRTRGGEVSAVRRDGGGLVVRMFNPGSQPASATVGETVVGLRPGEIVAVRPTPRPRPG
jgi:alpha-mannosidase